MQENHPEAADSRAEGAEEGGVVVIFVANWQIFVAVGSSACFNSRLKLFPENARLLSGGGKIEKYLQNHHYAVWDEKSA